MDSGGRVVIPKALRDRIGLAAGEELELWERDGRIEMEPAATSMRLSKDKRASVAIPDVELPPLTDEVVRATLERIRR